MVTSDIGGQRELLRRLAAPDPPPFALLHRRSLTGLIEVLIGSIRELPTLDELPLPGSRDCGERVIEMLVAIPFRQITERGYACQDDKEPILALEVAERASLTVAEAIDLLPDGRVTVVEGEFDVGDGEYERVVNRVIEDEISVGAGSNFVIKRSFAGMIEGYQPATALTVFRWLLLAESNAYWTFVVYTGDRTFVGASPEQHVQVVGDVVRMNPISGTYRYPDSGADLGGVLAFLADRKEIGELHMVVDEELKMLAGVCTDSVQVRGPYLHEMARLAHTEYMLEGRGAKDVREVLRNTMFAPTVIGSPLENACRVVARHESGGRGYYSGALALIGGEADGTSTVDSTIMIRTAQIRPDGSLRVDVGATLVGDSVPAAEVAETHAKVDVLLDAIGAARPKTGGRTGTSIAVHPAVQDALRLRTQVLSPFWFGDDATASDGAASGRVLIVDFEDAFTRMLGLQIRALGHEVCIRPWTAVQASDLDGYDWVVLGPGPGDPRDPVDPRLGRARELVGLLLDGAVPFFAECLSHQILCAMLGLELSQLDRPNQGVQRRVTLFGESESVGFYNSYVARHPTDVVWPQVTRGPAELCRDQRTGEVFALRGNGFASVQFHMESVLTQRGTHILADMAAWAVRGPGRSTGSRPSCIGVPSEGGPQ